MGCETDAGGWKRAWARMASTRCARPGAVDEDRIAQHAESETVHESSRKVASEGSFDGTPNGKQDVRSIVKMAGFKVLLLLEKRWDGVQRHHAAVGVFGRVKPTRAAGGRAAPPASGRRR